jgi:hypothetical protein
MAFSCTFLHRAEFEDHLLAKSLAFTKICVVASHRQWNILVGAALGPCHDGFGTACQIVASVCADGAERFTAR